MWEAGQAAIRVLKTTVETEVTYGNHKNIPESMLCLYFLCCIPELEQLEQEGASLDERMKVVTDIMSAIKYMKTRDDSGCYSAMVHGLNTLNRRSRTMSSLPSRDQPMAVTDYTYGGQLPFNNEGGDGLGIEWHGKEDEEQTT